MGETSPVWLLIGVIALILVAVAIFVGTLVYLQRAQSSKQAQEESPRPQPQPPERPLADPLAQAPLQVAAPPAETPASPGEVMRVIRDERTGRVLVEVDGQRYTHIREISDAQVGRRVLWAIADLVRFTGGMATNPHAVRGAAQERNEAASSESALPTREVQAGLTPDNGMPGREVQPSAGQTREVRATGTDHAPTSTPPVAQPVVPAESAATSRPTERVGRLDGPAPANATQPWAASATDTPATEPRGSSILEFFRRGFQPAAAVGPAAQPGSFIDEIEAILQQHISSHHTPLPYDVHVKTGLHGALQIEVGPNVYGSPEQIPDPEVKELIKTAVAEWERR